MSDAELKRIVTSGVSGAGMPPFGFLGGAQITSIVRYLRTLQGKGTTGRMPGDPQQGATVFFGKAGCSECHMANGKGGFIASDLTAYGNGRNPAEIREALVAPRSDPDQGPKQAVVVTRSGQKIQGTRAYGR